MTDRPLPPVPAILAGGAAAMVITFWAAWMLDGVIAAQRCADLCRAARGGW